MSKMTEWFEKLLGFYEEDDEEETESKNITPDQNVHIDNESNKAVRIDTEKQVSRISIMIPHAYAESAGIVKKISSGEVVIVNYAMCEYSTARRIFHFVSGAVYAINGSCSKIANNIFIYTPNNVTSISTSKKNESLDNTISKYWTISRGKE